MSIVGVSTALFAAITGLVQNDLKRVIAYSTCSQLGYMTFSCGLSTYQISYFRLLNHGCFKALLFLGAGALIRTAVNKQDIRFLGGIHLKLPLSYSFFIVGSLALIGFPFLSGFYSKDLIIEISFINHRLSGFYIYSIGVYTAFLTALYSTRLLYLVFLNIVCHSQHLFKNLKENGFAISLSLLVLSTSSVYNGFLASDLFLGMGSNYFSNIIFSSVNRFNLISSEFVSSSIKNLPFFLSCLAVFLVFFSSLKFSLSLSCLKRNRMFHTLHQFLFYR